MASRAERPPAPDPEHGRWNGRSVARRFESPDGLTVLVGRNATDNDILTFKLGSPDDWWLHAAGTSGAHVVVRNPDRLKRLPRDTLRFAAALAAGYSGARSAGRMAVHVAHCADVRKPRGAPPGTVSVGRTRTVFATPAHVTNP